MKKYFLAITIAIIAAIGFTGCEKENGTLKNSQTVCFEQYDYLGEAHNLCLSNVKNNLVEESSIETISDCCNYLSSFNIDFSNGNPLFEQLELPTLNYYFDVFKVYYNTSALYNDAFESDKLTSMINELLSTKSITESDVDIINLLLLTCFEQHSGNISIDEYYNNIEKLVEKWKRSNDDNSVSDFTAIILNIAFHSAQWWKDNPEESKVAPWVAADAVGAAWGATVAAATSKIQTGHVNWTSTGVAAVSGAVTGSTGIVGKAGKWISKLIK